MQASGGKHFSPPIRTSSLQRAHLDSAAGKKKKEKKNNIKNALVLLPLLPLANLDGPYVLEGVRRSDYSTLREAHVGCFSLTLNGTATTAAPISPVIAALPPPLPLRARRSRRASASWFYVPPTSVSVLFLSFRWAKSL